MAANTAPEYYTVEEAEAQIEAFPEVVWVRLAELARIRAWAVPDRTAEDFLQEALLRVLEGRRWPRGLSPQQFFAQTLRSLVSDYWKAKARERRHLDVRLATEFDASDPDEGPMDVITAHADPAPTPEQAHFAAQVLQEFLDTLDPEARDVVEWQLEGYAKAEIRADLGLDDTAYDTIARRIRRSLAEGK